MFDTLPSLYWDFFLLLTLCTNTSKQADELIIVHLLFFCKIVFVHKVSTYFMSKRKEAYKKFLQSPAWQAKRDIVRKRAKGICERCGNHQQGCMAVHHTTYEFGWDCSPAWLVYLCCDCHDFIHGKSYDDPCNGISFNELEMMIDNL